MALGKSLSSFWIISWFFLCGFAWAAEPQQVLAPTLSNTEITSCCWLNQHTLALGTEGGGILEYQRKENKVVQRGAGGGEEPLFVVGADETQIVAYSRRGAFLIDQKTWEWTKIKSRVHISQVGLSSNMNQAFFVDYSAGAIECWSLKDRKTLWMITLPSWSESCRVPTICTSPNSQQLLVLCSGFVNKSDRRAVILDTATGNILHDIIGIQVQGYLCAASFSPQSERKILLSSACDNFLELDVTNGKIRSLVRLKNKAAEHVALVKTEVVPVVSSPGALELVDAKLWKVVQSFSIAKGDVYGIKHTPDESAIAFVTRAEKLNHLYVVELEQYR